MEVCGKARVNITKSSVRENKIVAIVQLRATVKIFPTLASPAHGQRVNCKEVCIKWLGTLNWRRKPHFDDGACLISEWFAILNKFPILIRECAEQFSFPLGASTESAHTHTLVSSLYLATTYPCFVVFSFAWPVNVCAFSINYSHLFWTIYYLIVQQHKNGDEQHTRRTPPPTTTTKEHCL